MESLVARKRLHAFLFLLIISLVGNACADFALIWNGVARLGNTPGHFNFGATSLLSSFYVGQALGIMFLAPLLATNLDNFGKREVGIGLDVGYSLVLALMFFFNHYGLIGPVTLLPFAVVTAALGVLHRNVVGFGALKALSNELSVTSVVAKFTAALFFSNFIGAAVAGLAFSRIGLNGCLLIAIATFVPMPFVYFRVLPRRESISSVAKRQRDFYPEFIRGFSTILSDKVLLINSMSISIWNLSANIFPGVVGIAFHRSNPDRQGLATLAVTVSIALGLAAFFPLEKCTKNMPARWILPVAVSLPAAVAFIGVCYPVAWLFGLAYAFHCCGSAMVNILSGSLRVVRVDSCMTGRVNTAHTSLISVGQILGGLFLLPLLEDNLRVGALCISLSFVISGAISFLGLPNMKLSDLPSK